MEADFASDCTTVPVECGSRSGHRAEATGDTGKDFSLTVVCRNLCCTGHEGPMRIVLRIQARLVHSAFAAEMIFDFWRTLSRQLLPGTVVSG